MRYLARTSNRHSIGTVTAKTLTVSADRRQSLSLRFEIGPPSPSWLLRKASYQAARFRAPIVIPTRERGVKGIQGSA